VVLAAFGTREVIEGTSVTLDQVRKAMAAIRDAILNVIDDDPPMTVALDPPTIVQFRAYYRSASGPK